MLHDNVRVTLAYTVLSTVAGSIALGSIFSNYVYLVTDGSNSNVGYITGLNGLAMVVVAPVCGWWADKHRRDWMLRVAGVVGVVMAVATMIGVTKGHYPLLCACLVGWGVYGGIQSPAMEALFADSVEPGERSRIFTIKYSLTQVASAMGPAISMAMFFFLGDEWEIPQCQHVIIAGLVLCLLPSLLLNLFDDDKASLSHSPQSLERQRREHEERLMLARQASAGNEEAPSRALTLPLLSAPTGAGGLEEGEKEEKAAASGESSNSGDDSRGRASCCCRPNSNGKGFCAQNYIPTIIVITDVCFALASGMSIKFFPLMFMETYNLSPMMVSLLYVVSPLATALASFAAQRASRRLGRVATTIGFKFAGVALLALMCYLDFAYPAAALVAPVFVLRTACMNCTKALTRSIVMDAVPKETRAKWNSLESVTGATWAGSAVIGGLLVDRYGFLSNNLATAALQFCSTLPLFLVLGLVPTEHVTPAGGLLYEGVMGSAGLKAEEEEEEQLSRSAACKALFPQPSEADTGDLEVAKRLAEARRLVGEGDPALDAPLEEEGDLGLLERLLKGAGEAKGGGRRGRVGRASMIGESC